jgi:hypothetical protein
MNTDLLREGTVEPRLEIGCVGIGELPVAVSTSYIG